MSALSNEFSISYTNCNEPVTKRRILCDPVFKRSLESSNLQKQKVVVKMESCYLMDMDFQFYKMKEFWRLAAQQCEVGWKLWLPGAACSVPRPGFGARHVFGWSLAPGYRDILASISGFWDPITIAFALGIIRCLVGALHLSLGFLPT